MPDKHIRWDPFKAGILVLTRHDQDVNTVAEKQVEQAQKYIQEKFIENYLAHLKSTVSEKCFEKCFDPKTSDKPINTTETGCHALCCDRYRECKQFVHDPIAKFPRCPFGNRSISRENAHLGSCAVRDWHRIACFPENVNPSWHSNAAQLILLRQFAEPCSRGAADNSFLGRILVHTALRTLQKNIDTT